jgi:hypothetical protein
MRDMTAPSALTARPPESWRRFSRLLIGASAALFGLLALLILVADPFGVRIRPGSTAPVLMDSNQRYMYPQLVRSGRFDAAVIGTSSSRLLDPERLSAAFGARFANLAMNAATPWEQMRMSRLIRENWPAPKAVIWGIDVTWCEADADSAAKRLTPRPFPEAFYQQQAPGLAAMLGEISLTSLEIAARRAGNWLGLAKPRMRADGYDEFTPPDATYDAARARFHLYFDNGGSPPSAMPPAPGVAQGTGAHAFPALGWLEAELAALPPATRRLILLPPQHWASLPGAGAAQVARDAACKAALVQIADRVDATLLDYRLLSPLTREDARFWDPLHYRIDVARRIEADLRAADQGAMALHDDVVVRALQRVDAFR